MTYHFIIRKSLKSKCTGNICVRLTHKRRSLTITFALKLHPEEWDQVNEISTSNKVNQQIKKYASYLDQIIEMHSYKDDYTVDEIALNFRCHLGGNTLLQYTENIVKTYIKNTQTRTARAYMSAAIRFTRFYKGQNLLLSDISTSLLLKFEKHLQEEGLSRNTTSFYMRNLRAIYNKALEEKVILLKEESPFAKVFTGIEKTRKRALRKHELNILQNIDLSHSRAMDYARSIFLFGFHACGMSFVDIAHLQKKNIQGNYIRYKRKKTGRTIQVKITKPLQALINYFQKLTVNSPYLTPIISLNNDKSERLQYESALSKQNKALKRLGKFCKFNRPLTTHVGRHSWASLARSIDTPLGVISECLGHNDEKTTYIYLASFDKRVTGKATERVSKLVDYSISTISTPSAF